MGGVEGGSSVDVSVVCVVADGVRSLDAPRVPLQDGAYVGCPPGFVSGSGGSAAVEGGSTDTGNATSGWDGASRCRS